MVNTNERIIPRYIERNSTLIGRRINENLLKIKNEDSEVKSLLSLAVQTSKPQNYTNDAVGFNQISFDMSKQTRNANEYNLLRTCITLATSRNTTAQENLMEVIDRCLISRYGQIKKRHYEYIANLISLKDPQVVSKVNDFLCENLAGYAELHAKLGNKYYAF